MEFNIEQILKEEKKKRIKMDALCIPYEEILTIKSNLVSLLERGKLRNTLRKAKNNDIVFSVSYKEEIDKWANSSKLALARVSRMKGAYNLDEAYKLFNKSKREVSNFDVHTFRIERYIGSIEEIDVDVFLDRTVKAARVEEIDLYKVEISLMAFCNDMEIIDDMVLLKMTLRYTDKGNAVYTNEGQILTREVTKYIMGSSKIAETIASDNRLIVSIIKDILQGVYICYKDSRWYMQDGIATSVRGAV